MFLIAAFLSQKPSSICQMDVIFGAFHFQLLCREVSVKHIASSEFPPNEQLKCQHLVEKQLGNIHWLFWVFFPILWEVNTWLWTSRTKHCQASRTNLLAAMSKSKTDDSLYMSPHSGDSQKLSVTILCITDRSVAAWSKTKIWTLPVTKAMHQQKFSSGVCSNSGGGRSCIPNCPAVDPLVPGML